MFWSFSLLFDHRAAWLNSNLARTLHLSPGCVAAFCAMRHFLQAIAGKIHHNNLAPPQTMSNAAAIAICSIISLECVFILIGNIFTIYVFWTHRKHLRRTSSLLINLAVVDRLVGLTEPVAIGTMTIPRHFEEDGPIISTQDNISSMLPTMFSCLSLFSLALISVERAYAVIWLLRHRVTGNKWYICSLFIVWSAGMVVCASFLLHQAEMLRFFF